MYTTRSPVMRNGGSMKSEYAVPLWHDEHERFLRLLDFLDTEMMCFHEGGHPNYDLMRDVIYYLQHYADRYHHPREDMAFELMLKRDAALAPHIKRLMHEHRVIKTVGNKLYKYLEDIIEDTFIPRETVEAAAATYLVYYRSHIKTEEMEILPQAIHLLQEEDWTQVAAAVPAAPDPLFGNDISARYRDLRIQIAREKALTH